MSLYTLKEEELCATLIQNFVKKSEQAQIIRILLDCDNVITISSKPKCTSY